MNEICVINRARFSLRFKIECSQITYAQALFLRLIIFLGPDSGALFRSFQSDGCERLLSPSLSKLKCLSPSGKDGIEILSIERGDAPRVLTFTRQNNNTIIV